MSYRREKDKGRNIFRKGKITQGKRRKRENMQEGIYTEGKKIQEGKTTGIDKL